MLKTSGLVSDYEAIEHILEAKLGLQIMEQKRIGEGFGV
jgi:hypothetical protein